VLESRPGVQTRLREGAPADTGPTEYHAVQISTFAESRATSPREARKRRLSGARPRCEPGFARPGAHAIAGVHVASWHAAYRGLMPDDVPAGPVGVRALSTCSSRPR
jgi:hypothetical protein